MKKANKLMCCPFCGKELTFGDSKRFETLCDHVFDPNGDYELPMRPTWVCDCEKSALSFWDDFGDFYTRGDWEFDTIKSALNSSCREMDEKHAREHKLRKTLSGRVVLWVERKVPYSLYKIRCFLLCKKPLI